MTLTDNNIRFAVTLWQMIKDKDWTTDIASTRKDLEGVSNQISDWDVSKVTDFSGLFASDVSKVGNSFNEDISKWDVSSGM
jgi:hypothetical protein